MLKESNNEVQGEIRTMAKLITQIRTLGHIQKWSKDGALFRKYLITIITNFMNFKTRKQLTTIITNFMNFKTLPLTIQEDSLNVGCSVFLLNLFFFVIQVLHIFKLKLQSPGTIFLVCLGINQQKFAQKLNRYGNINRIDYCQTQSRFYLFPGTFSKCLLFLTVLSCAFAQHQFI